MAKGSVGLVFVGIVAALTCARSFAADEATSPLRRPVAVSARNGSLSDYLLALFRSAGASGGLAIVNNQCLEVRAAFPEFKGTVQDALENLSSAGHELHWSLAGDGLVVYNTPSTPPLLAVRVHEFRFSHNEPLTKASTGLFDAPEAREKAKELHLTEYGPELGFAQLRRPDTPQDIVVLTDATVLEALNRIAGNHAVWLYKESRCESNVISLNWPIR